MEYASRNMELGKHLVWLTVHPALVNTESSIGITTESLLLSLTYESDPALDAGDSVSSRK